MLSKDFISTGKRSQIRWVYYMFLKAHLHPKLARARILRDAHHQNTGDIRFDLYNVDS